MARQTYGAGVADFTTTSDFRPQPSVALLAWRDRVGGVAEADLLPLFGTVATGGVIYSDTDARVGVYGPDGYSGHLWVSAAVFTTTGTVDTVASGNQPRYQLTGGGYAPLVDGVVPAAYLPALADADVAALVNNSTSATGQAVRNIAGTPVLVLAAADPVPAGTAAGTVILRTA